MTAWTALAAALALAAAPKAPRRAEPPLPTGKAHVTETAVDPAAQDDAKKLAEAYLNAISHQGNDGAIESLLGGATLTARMIAIENWKIVGREKLRREEGALADLSAFVAAIDRAGREALARMMGGGPGSTDADGLGMTEITQEQATRILRPTKERAALFNKTHPVFAYIARVDRQVYWHPKNPFRRLLADAGEKGPYTAEIHLFWVETIEGAHQDKRVRKWPLRIVRFRAGALDTGLKVLPASDWNAE